MRASDDTGPTRDGRYVRRSVAVALLLLWQLHQSDLLWLLSRAVTMDFGHGFLASSGSGVTLVVLGERRPRMAITLAEGHRLSSA